MRQESLRQRRPRIGRPGRAASWLVAFALLVQSVFGAGEALGMWMAAQGPGQMAASHCAQHAGAGKHDPGSGGASHDHERCLLCNVAAADCPAPILPMLAAAMDRTIVPVPPATSISFRKVAYANAARGPPLVA